MPGELSVDWVAGFALFSTLLAFVPFLCSGVVVWLLLRDVPAGRRR